jgi:hypothetical protein
MSDPVPAIAEAAAIGETATIFADIRQVLGVDVVNLIWRHLATIEGALAWAWSTLRPLYVDGSVTAEAAMLHAELALPPMPQIPVEVFSGLGIRRDDLVAINDVLAAYHRTNAMALVALSALQAVLAGRARSSGETDGQTLPALPPSPRIALPALPSLSELPADTTALVMALNGFGTRRQGAILASMYRHLAYWPSYLASAWLLLAPLDADRRLEAAIATAVQAAERRARRLLARLSAAEIAPPPLATTIATAIEPFVGDVIAKMVVICALLRDATPGDMLARP